MKQFYLSLALLGASVSVQAAEVSDPLEAVLSGLRQREVPAFVEMLWKANEHGTEGSRYFYTTYADGAVLTERRGDSSGLVYKEPGSQAYRRCRYLLRPDGTCLSAFERDFKLTIFSESVHGALHPRYDGFFEIQRPLRLADPADWFRTAWTWESLTDKGDRVEVRGRDQARPDELRVFVLLKTEPNYTLIESYQESPAPPELGSLPMRLYIAHMSYDAGGFLIKVSWSGSAGDHIRLENGVHRVVRTHPSEPFRTHEVVWYRVAPGPLFEPQTFASLDPVVGMWIGKTDPDDYASAEYFRWDGTSLLSDEDFDQRAQAGLIDLTLHDDRENSSEKYDTPRFASTTWPGIIAAARANPAKWKDYALDAAQYKQYSSSEVTALMDRLDQAKQQVSAGQSPGAVFDGLLAVSP